MEVFMSCEDHHVFVVMARDLRSQGMEADEIYNSVSRAHRESGDAQFLFDPVKGDAATKPALFLKAMNILEELGDATVREVLATHMEVISI